VGELSTQLKERAEREKQWSQQSQADADRGTIQTALEATDETEYPYSKAYGAERVAQVAYARWEESDGRLTVEEIVDKIEDELIKEHALLARAAEKTAGGKQEAPQALPSRSRAEKPKSANTEGNGRTRSPSTLTNKAAAARATPEAPTSSKDRMARAVALLAIDD
jgi:hypothetical protein